VKLPSADIAVLLIYLAGVVGFGCWFVRRSRTTDGYMAAGRSLPGWAVGLSIFGTYVSSISFLALPGNAYGGNWNAFAFSLSLPIAAWLAVRYFVPFYRAGGEVSAYHHLERRFGPWARTYAVVCYLSTQLARMGAILYLVALAVQPLTGWDVPTIILIAGVLVTLYTLLGGIEAVIWTDVVQSIVLTSGALVCGVLLLTGMPEGPGQLFRVAADNHKFSLGSFGPSLVEPTFWVVLVYGLVINLQNFGVDQSYVQRYITAKSDRDAKKSVWLGALMYLPVSAMFLFIGTALFAFYTVQPDLLPAAVGAADKPDAVFPHFIHRQLPTGITGLLVAAIFAAAMSTVDSSLNSSATLILADIYQRYFRKNAGQRESMRVLRLTTLVWGALGTRIALSLVIHDVQSALDVWWKLSGIVSGGMLGLFLLGLISRRANNPAAVTGVVVGVLGIVWMTLSLFPSLWTEATQPFRSPLHSFMIIVVGTLSILLVGLVVSRLTGRA
jgi:SSS family solute:Na+ symporter